MLACENSRFSSLLAAGDVSWEGKSASQRQKFHTDDVKYQTTYNIQVAKTPWQYLGHKSHCWKAHFFKICFFVKYFRQRLLSLVNMSLHAAIIRLSPLIHEGEQRWVASVTAPPPLKNHGYAPAVYKTGDRTELGNYRPISLLSMFNRLFERLLRKRLTSFIKKKNTFFIMHSMVSEQTVLLNTQFWILNTYIHTYTYTLFMLEIYRVAVELMYSRK